MTKLIIKGLVLSFFFAPTFSVEAFVPNKYVKASLSLRQAQALVEVDRRETTARNNGIHNGGIFFGRITNALTGNGISRIRVEVRRQLNDPEPIMTLSSSSSGDHRSPYILPGRYFLTFTGREFVEVSGQEVWIERGHETQVNIGLTPPLPPGQYRFVMSWTNAKDNAVRDVDSYLLIPGVIRPLGYPKSGELYHGAKLDLDDTSWRGPETVTIMEPRSTGTYIYYVDNYNARGSRRALGNSEIKMDIFQGNARLHSLSVPQGEGLRYEFFRIEDGILRLTGVYNDSLPHY